MEPKKLVSPLDDDVLTLSSRDGFPFPPIRPQSPSPSGRFTLRRSLQSTRSSISALSALSFSSSSASASASASDPATLVSCVTHDIAKEDCATLRFIVWAAVRRNASERMTDHERLECPLLHCTRRFPDHESMLRHLVVCDCLSSCEYWCYGHMRVERFDECRCKKCLGHPSKRRKMLSRAKHFFTALGHNTKGKGLAGTSFSPSPSFVSTSVSPCALADQDGVLDCSGERHGDSGYSTRHNSQRRPDDSSEALVSSSLSSPPFLFYDLPPPDCEAINGNSHAELPATGEIPAEIDSRELTAIPQPSVFFEHVSLAQSSLVTHPVPIPCFAASASALAEPQTGSVNPQDLLLPELESMDWEPQESTMPSISSVINCPDGLSNSFPSFLDLHASNVSRPFLQLDTQSHDAYSQILNVAPPQSQAMQRLPRPSTTPTPRSKNLSPSSSVRSTTSTTSTTSTASAMSAASTATTASTATSVSLVSTVGAENRLVSPISDCSHGSNSWTTGLDTNLTSPTDDLTDFFADDYIFANAEDTVETGACEVLNLPTDDAFGLEEHAGALMAESLFLDFDTPKAETHKASMDATTMVSSMDSGLIDVPSAAPNSSETKRMVTSAWDMLLTHIMISSAKLRRANYANNPLASLLQSTTPERVADTGIGALQTALASGNENMSPFTTLCFLHVVYAFSLVTYGSEVASHSDDLFTQALAYSRNFSGLDRDNYRKVASAIWQPSSLPPSHSQLVKSLSTTDLALGNPVMATAKAFLDDLEMSTLVGRGSPLLMNREGSAHAVGDFVSSTSTILRTLLQEFPDKVGMVSGLNDACRRASTKAPGSVRRFELELLKTGKASLGSSVFFSTFAPRVRQLCDPLYDQHGANLRLAYYEQSIFLIRAIMFKAKESQEQGSQAKDPSKTGDKTQLALGTVDYTANPASLAPQVSAVSMEPASASAESTAGQRREVAHSCCEICGYRPKGDPQWFRGSMNKHMKTKHSGEVIYKCPYPNCNSQYRNRLDNLQQHQREKNHFVGAQAVTKKLRRQNLQQSENSDEQSEMDTPRRPSKRVKME